MHEEEFLYRTFDLNFQVPGEDAPRSWQLTRPLPPMKAAYAKYISRLALQGIQQHRDVMDDVAYQSAMDAWMKGFTSGAYAWRSRGFVETFDDEENRKAFATEWLRQVDPKVTRQLVEKWWTVTDSREAADYAATTDEASEGSLVGQPLTFGQKMWSLIVEMFSERNPTRPPSAGAARS